VAEVLFVYNIIHGKYSKIKVKKKFKNSIKVSKYLNGLFKNVPVPLLKGYSIPAIRPLVIISRGKSKVHCWHSFLLGLVLMLIHTAPDDWRPVTYALPAP